MDSNFQVRISANIQDLQRSIKEAQATLAQFKQSADGAAAATKKMEAEANRGRLVAFAFGQVLRDAGFFAQDFRLGILAISNNIPILIDQLVLLSNVSKGVGAAISLLGSLLTAGLTIWAYTASGVDNFTKSLKEYKTAVNESRASAETEIVTLKSLLAIANDQSLSLSQRQDAINRVNNEYKVYNNELTINNVNSQKNKDTTDRLTSAILLQAKASAEAAYYTKLQSQLYEAQDKPLSEQVSLFEKVGIVLASTVKKNDDLNRSIMNLDFKGLVDTYKGLFQLRGMENFADTFNKLSPAIDQSKARIEALNKALTGQGVETEKGRKKVSDYQKALESLSDSLKSISADESLTISEQSAKRIDAYKKAISDLATVNTAQAAAKIDELRVKIAELNKEVFKSEGNKFAVDLFSKKIKQDAEDSIAELDNLNAEIQKGLDSDELQKKNDNVAKSFANLALDIRNILQEGLVNTIAETFAGLGEAIANGTNVAEGALSGFLNASAGMLAQFGQGLIKTAIETGIMAGAIGKAIAGIKAALATMNPLVAIAAGAALLALAGAARAGARNIANGGSGGGSSAAAPATSFGGINSGAVRFPTNTSAMNNPFSPGSVIAETRVSGNDLSILMKRADNNRNEYF